MLKWRYADEDDDCTYIVEAKRSADGERFHFRRIEIFNLLSRYQCETLIDRGFRDSQTNGFEVAAVIRLPAWGIVTNSIIKAATAVVFSATQMINHDRDPSRSKNHWSYYPKMKFVLLWECEKDERPDNTLAR